jgi:Amt family ammonium transporter
MKLLTARTKKRKTLFAAKVAVFVAAGVAALAIGAPAGAQEADPTMVLGQQVNLLWIILGAILVVFMQAGFALVETGFTRAKHAAHVVSTNFAIFGLGFVGFMIIGFPLAFGGFTYDLPGFDWGYGGNPIGDSLIGSGSWTFLWSGPIALSGNEMTPAVLGFFFYMVAFMDTVATIPTGSMAERWKWNSFVVWGLFCGAFYYPLFAAWTWGGGWLNKSWDTMGLGAGYVDFAGSGVVHAVGGAAALAGAIVLGPRLGKFNADKTPNTIPGHHVPMAMLGTFILLFGWFGFNAASTFAATDVQFATVATNTAIAGAFGATTTMFYCMFFRGKKPDPGMMANGMLAGLVAITAPCAFVKPGWAAVIGIIAGILVVESVYFIEKRGIDDAVGAISVHGVCGSFGVLAVGIFADGHYGAAWNGSDVEGVKGIIYGDAGQLGAQALGVLVIWTVIFGIAFAFFKIQDMVTPGGIRSKEEDELGGLDLPEMGAMAYPEFMELDPPLHGSSRGSSPMDEQDAPI